MRADVEALVGLGVRASVIESPISDGKLAALGVSRKDMLDRIRSAIAFAVEQGIRVAFFGVDSTRADLEFVRAAYEGAVEAGAEEVVVVDTLGIATPEAAALPRRGGGGAPRPPGPRSLARARRLRPRNGGGGRRRPGRGELGTGHGERDGERAGNADLVEVALALEALYGIPTRLRLEQARRARPPGRGARRARRSPPWKAVTGDNLFTRESGAVASQFHDPPAIEPYASEVVGAERGIVLGKKSGLDSIRIKAEELGLDVSEDDRAALLEAVKRAGTKKGGLVTDAEFRRLVRRGGARASS